MRASKPPPQRIFSDAFEIVQDGTSYYPHAGEWVEYRGHGTVGAYLDGLHAKLQMTAAAETPTAVETLVEGAFIRQLEELTRTIVAWSWTDDSGEPLPSPPGIDVLRRMSMEELQWLASRGAIATGADRAALQPGADIAETGEQKNGSGGSSSSTATSRLNRTQRRRTSG